MLFLVSGWCIRNAVAECTLRQYSSKYSRVKLFLTLICIIELLVDTKLVRWLVFLWWLSFSRE